jgi:hypothetical protein
VANPKGNARLAAGAETIEKLRNQSLPQENEAAPALEAFTPAPEPDATGVGLTAIKAGLAAGVIENIEAFPVRILQAGYVLADATRTAELRQNELAFLMSSLRMDTRAHRTVVSFAGGREGGTLTANTDAATTTPEYRRAQERCRQATLARDNAGAVLEALRLRAAILLATERSERE